MKFLLNIVLLLLSNFLQSSRSEDPGKPWLGRWFPENPFNDNGNNGITIKNPEVVCDDVKTNLTTDYVDSSQFSFNYLCLDKRYLYTPNASTIAILTQRTIPPTYEAPKLCMNESIEYIDQIPTFGAHRVHWAKYGEYKYLPPQRWLHNVENGAIVVLYHPCANKNQLNKLKILVKSCLYRYVITASQRLQPERPFVIIAWGKSLQMSVINQQTVVNFITDNALKGPKSISDSGLYDLDILHEAKLVTTISDDKLCPQNDIIMR